MASIDFADDAVDASGDDTTLPKKSFKSSIVIIPPEEFWDPIQRIRKDHDKAYQRWMPHINMLYPFIADDTDGNFFSTAAEELKSALKDIQPFKVYFTKDSFKVFKRKKSSTLWLKPQTSSEPDGNQDCEEVGSGHPEVLNLQETMVKMFPQCNDVNKIADHGFTPHLSLGQIKHQQLHKLIDEFTNDWPHMEFTIDQVALISRADFDDPFHVKHRVPLGSV